MPGARYLPVNIVDTATVTSNELLRSTLPASNVKIQGRENFTQLSAIGGSGLRMSWPSSQAANMIHVGLHNLSATATVAVYLYSDAALTTLIYSGVITPAYANSGLSSIIDYRAPDFQIFRNSTIYFPLRSGFQSAQIILFDSSNLDGYLQAGRLAMGVYKEFKYQDGASGANRQTKTMTQKTRAKSGNMIIDKGANYNHIEIKKEWLDESADAADFIAFASLVAHDKEFFYSQYPGLGTYDELYHHGMWTVGEMSAIDRWVHGLSRTSFTLEGQ